MMSRRITAGALCMLVALLAACSRHPPAPVEPAGSASAPAAAHEHTRVAMETDRGTIVLELYDDRAPRTVANFLVYVRAHQYDGEIFHRVIPGFMIQGGGYDGSLNERPVAAPIVNEADNGIKNESGTIAMARTSAPDSATAQFFINVADNGFLDHIEIPPGGTTVTRGGRAVALTPADRADVFGYAVFGKVISGMDVVQAIAATPTTSRGAFANLPTQTVVIRSVKILP